MANSLWTPSNTALDVEEIHSYRNEDDGSISGNPMYTTRLQVPYAQISAVKTDLLGVPESWPHVSSIIQDVVCVQIRSVNDGSRYQTESTNSLIHHEGNFFFDVVYMPRVGRYLIDVNGKAVFWNDEFSPRLESRPMNHKHLIWGSESSPSSVPNDHIPLHSDEAPSKYDNGQTMIHTIEGWDINYDDLDDLVGTVHNDSYLSPITGTFFVSGMMFLRNYTEEKGFFFTSYRHGAPSTRLKLHYEIKSDWQKYWRIDLQNNVEGYYYILRNVSPYDRLEYPPLADHTKYLGWVP